MDPWSSSPSSRNPYKISNGPVPYSPPSSSYRTDHGLKSPSKSPTKARNRPSPYLTPTKGRRGLSKDIPSPTKRRRDLSEGIPSPTKRIRGLPDGFISPIFALPNHPLEELRTRSERHPHAPTSPATSSSTVAPPPLPHTPVMDARAGGELPTDYLAYPNVRVGERVHARVLYVKERQWGIWQPARVTKKWVQTVFRDHQIPCYNVQVTARSEWEVPATYFLAAFNGTLWDGVGTRPYVKAQYAIASLRKFQTVLAPQNLTDTNTWVPARVTGSLLVNPLTIVYHPHHAPDPQQDGQTPLAAPECCPWDKADHRGECHCNRVEIRMVYTYCAQSVEQLRHQGCTVHDNAPF